MRAPCVVVMSAVRYVLCGLPIPLDKGNEDSQWERDDLRRRPRRDTRPNGRARAFIVSLDFGACCACVLSSSLLYFVFWWQVVQVGRSASPPGGSRKFRKRGPSSPPPPNENFPFQDMQHTALWVEVTLTFQMIE